MAKSPVSSDFRRLIAFLNIDKAKLENFEGGRPPADFTDEEVLLVTLHYVTGRHDNGQTLVKLRDEIREHVTKLLNVEVPAEQALHELLLRIAATRLAMFRSLKDQTRDLEHFPSREIDIVRVSPARLDQTGKQSPSVKRLTIVEYPQDDSAETYFYRIIENSLLNNTISQIRKCLWCENFYISARRLTYCSEHCETAFNNERKKQKRLLQRQEEEKTAKLNARANKDAAGRELFEKVGQLYKKTKPTNQDNQFLDRVRLRVTWRKSDFARPWTKLDRETQGEYIRAAQTVR